MASVRTQSDHDLPVNSAELAETDLLALRLEQLRDPAWTRALVDDALARLYETPSPFTTARVAYCKIKPNRDVNVAIEVELPDAAANSSRRQWISFTFLPSQRRARRRFDDELAQSQPPARPAVLLPDAAAIARAFPADPVLGALKHAIDPAQITALMRQSDGVDANLVAGEYQVLHYKPGRSCTMRYDLQLAGPEGVTRRELYGKVYRDERGAACHDLLRSAWEAASRSGGVWRAARPVAFVPRWRFVLQEAVPGRQFRHVFAQWTHDAAARSEIEFVAAQLRAIAEAVAAMQRAKPPAAPVCDFRYLMQAQRKNLEYLAGWHPELAQEIAEIRDELERLEPRIAPSPMVFAHGDFAHGNVLVAAEAVGLIDFDRAGLAEAPYDVAYFLTHLWSFGIRHPRRHAHVAQLCDVFRESYLALAPNVSPERLALYEALDFTAYVLRNFRKQSYQTNWFDWAGAQIRAARDRLALAAGKEAAR